MASNGTPAQKMFVRSDLDALLRRNGLQNGPGKRAIHALHAHKLGDTTYVNEAKVDEIVADESKGLFGIKDQVDALPVYIWDSKASAYVKTTHDVPVSA